MTDRAWAQLLFVTVPVLVLVGSWLALRAVGGRGRRGGDGERNGTEHDEANKQ